MATRLIALSELSWFEVDDVTQRIIDSIIDFETNSWSVYLCTKHTTASQARWLSSHIYAEGDKILALPDNGHRYVCTQAGRTGSRAPEFPTDSAATVEDNEVIWQEDGGSMSGWKRIDTPGKFELTKDNGYTRKQATVTNSGTAEAPVITIDQVTYENLDVSNANYAFVANDGGEILGYVQIGEAGKGVELGLSDLQFSVDQNYTLMQLAIDRCRVKRTTLNPSPFLNNTMSRYCNPQQGKHYYKGTQPELRVWDPGNPITQPNCLCTFVDVGPPVIIDPQLTLDGTGNYEYRAKCGPPPHSWELSAAEGVDISQWITIIDQYYEVETDLMDSDTPEHVCVIHADDPAGLAFTLTVYDGDGAEDSVDINTAPVPLIAFYGADIGSVGWALYDPVGDNFIEVDGYDYFDIPTDAVAYVSGPDAEHPLVMWLGTYTGYIGENNSFSDNIWDGYTDDQMIAYTNLEGNQCTIQFSKMDTHRVTMEHVTPEIWYSKIYENPDWETAWIIEERWSINDETGEFTQESYSNTYYGDVSMANIPDPRDITWQYSDWPYFYFDCDTGLFTVSKWAAKTVIDATEVEESGYVHSSMSTSETYTINCLETDQMADGGTAVYTHVWDLEHETWDYESDQPYGQRPWRPLYPVPAFCASDGASLATEDDEVSFTEDTYSLNDVITVSLSKDQIHSYDDPYVLHDYTQTSTKQASGSKPPGMGLDEIKQSIPAVILTNEIVPQRLLDKFSVATASGKLVKVIATDLETKIYIDGDDQTSHLQALYNALTGETLGLTGLTAICYHSPPEE